MRARSGIATVVLIGALPIALIVGVWHVLAATGMAPPSLLPAPSAVAARLVQQWSSPAYLEHAASTLLRLFAGFGIAVIAGIAIGVAVTASRWVGATVTPLVRVLAPVPKIALYPAFILTLGFGDASKIALVVADAVFPILLATAQGTAAVEPKLAWSAQAAGASRWRCLLTVVLPAALPSVLTGCRIGLVISCIVVFLAEMITSTDGLGHLLVRAARSFQTVDMFVPLITISLLGLLLNAGFNAVRRRLLAGFPETTE
ncbi:ABC transporter permease [Vineibacter terrae]|uniref:ABC transporter permease n=1 Tax=Vineibacter terrae TaxID=2586908 RepID=A0A5C8PAL6_9HYPH|nr:ABC transporter permease [Vineibacter terrae]TXL70808.1 ABC transporter permease [Vineibacter terrae]